jgi:hypothetical protein
MERETIVELAAEGGSITLYKDQRGKFVIDVYDWTYELIDEEPSNTRPFVVNSWDAALSILNEKYPHWTKLALRSVHPDYRHAVEAAIRKRY